MNETELKNILHSESSVDLKVGASLIKGNGFIPGAYGIVFSTCNNTDT